MDEIETMARHSEAGVDLRRKRAWTAIRVPAYAPARSEAGEFFRLYFVADPAK